MATSPSQLGQPGHERTSLIGRGLEVEAVAALVLNQRERLVTLTGTGGCGKTSLALEVADRLRQHFPDGVFLVDLGRIADPTVVAEIMSEALGLRPDASIDPLATLVEHLQPRTALLLLDNCEHLVEACASLVETLLATCPGVQILATSREPLRAAGERQWRVPSLPVPPVGEAATLEEVAASPSVRLFVERAAAVSPGFALTPENVAAISEICVRLEGLPLAIELAAARVQVLAVEQIRDRLDDCFRLLSGGSRAAPSRQQTLRSALDWSYNLLDDRERATFRRLGAFVGWFDLEAAEAVCDEPDAAENLLDILTQLVDKSLLLVEQRAGRARVRLLEPIRQYALHHLKATGEAEAALRRHLEHYLELAERLEPEVWGASGDQSGACEALEAERDNLSAALGWGVANDPPLAARLAGSLWQFWRLRGLLAEGRHWLETLLGLGAGLGVAKAKVAVGAAFLARDSGEVGVAEAHTYQAISAANATGDRWAKGMAVLSLGILAGLQGDGELSRRELLECLAYFRASDNRWGLATALYHLGYIARLDGDLPAARDYLEESLVCHQKIGDRRGVSAVLGALGRVYWLLGDPARANAYLEESLSIGRRIGIRDDSGLGLAALLARSAGDYVRARDLTRRGLDLLDTAGLQQHVPEHLCIQGTLLVDEGAHEQGVRLIAAADALGSASGQIDALVARTLGEASLEAARAALGAASFARVWEEGRLLSLPAAVEEALAAASAALSSPEPTETAEERAASVEPLTPREREVARLIALGYSDRRIAEALTIALGTVGVHVHRILGKLGLRSRWQVADWAAHNGLVEADVSPLRPGRKRSASA